ncbi:hypothetical protein SCATT_47050 [Streptantibioticus cattleyicolor NRRL 8057 = DSM 46488]|uniref:Uncharacterized protein n=1 Tax=Streptantibioticus cattleyicolor (strain ATCC 35852 / DSM 46488 / JCM 4925 / NBRC 14057 / NRRL 8057) TaxID=1003195 RepID=G8WT53_STREN|nr:hypothetical protein SCATT_47050 [Streptantibioticus cattleyicolor NRRL 8057 = DSM 46488]
MRRRDGRGDRLGDGRRPDRDLPVIALLGRHGSGKTAVLGYLAHRASTAPHAGFDFAAASLRPHEVAARLAFRLSMGGRSGGGPRFPRLTHGLVAVDPELRLDVNSPEQAKHALNKAMRSARRRSAGPAADAMSEAVGLLNDLGVIPVPGAGLMAALLLRGVGPRLVQRIAGAGLDWYGLDSPRGPLETLVELNERSRSEDPADQERVDRLLCEAFLADLRAAYTGRGGPSGDRNCLVVLDNIDHGGGTRFVRLLLELRESLRLRAGGGCDPLLMVVASSTARAVPGPFDPGPAGLRIRGGDQVGYADWRAAVPQSPADRSWWWYPVRLPELTASQVSQLGASVAPRLPEATPLVHRLTYGHPWSVLRMHQAAARMIDRPDADELLRAVLDARPPGRREEADEGDGPRPELTLSQEALAYLFQDMTAEQLAALVTCAAARDLESAVNSGLLEGFTPRVRDTLLEEAAERLWTVSPLHEDAGTRGGRGSGYLPREGPAAHPEPLPDSPVFQPWLWLVLLRELAGREAAGPYPDWTAAHTRLRDWHAGRPGGRLGAHYHQLALGEVDQVVAGLAAGLTTLPTEAWLYELYAVTAAPMRDPVDVTMPASHRADVLTRELAPRAYAERRSLALLVTSLWLAADPRNRLPSARPELNFTISAAFRDLALHADANGAVLRSEAARYETRTD